MKRKVRGKHRRKTFAKLTVIELIFFQQFAKKFSKDCLGIFSIEIQLDSRKKRKIPPTKNVLEMWKPIDFGCHFVVFFACSMQSSGSKSRWRHERGCLIRNDDGKAAIEFQTQLLILYRRVLFSFRLFAYEFRDCWKYAIS